jgi:hypothetical protein
MQNNIDRKSFYILVFHFVAQWGFVYTAFFFAIKFNNFAISFFGLLGVVFCNVLTNYINSRIHNKNEEAKMPEFDTKEKYLQYLDLNYNTILADNQKGQKLLHDIATEETFIGKLSNEEFKNYMSGEKDAL